MVGRTGDASPVSPAVATPLNDDDAAADVDRDEGPVG